MITPSPPDEPEAESLEPANDLVERRGARDEVIFRGWCETMFEMVQLGPEVFHPADILDALSPDAARRGRDEAAAQVREELEEIVCERFPAPIAVPFQAFTEGPRSSLVRLLRLRDTWEALVRMLSALAIAEAASCTPSMTNLVVREGRGNEFRLCRRRDLFSDKLAMRIGLIEGVLQRARELNISLEIANLLPLDVLSEIRRLNVVRNGFSHQSAISEKQAEIIIDEARPVLSEILLDLRGLDKVELIRICKIIPGSPPKAEIELLIGHAQSRRIRVISMEGEIAVRALAAAQVAGRDRVLARVGSRTLDLSPFVYAEDDEAGHRTRIAVFKCRTGGKWCMEYLSDSVVIEDVESPHVNLLTSLETLLANSDGI